MATEEETASIPVIAKLAGLTRQRVFQLHKDGLIPGQNIGAVQARYILGSKLLGWCKHQKAKRASRNVPIGIRKAIYDAGNLLIRMGHIRIACRRDPKARLLVKEWLLPELEREVGRLKNSLN
jgi:hypothetical protein